MTAINLIVKWPIIIAKWMLTSVMAVALVVSLLMLSNLGWISKPLPNNSADLQKVTITVKSAIISRSPQSIAPVEYPTQFQIDGQVSPDIVAKHLVNAGDAVDVYLTNEELQILKNKSAIPAFMQAYGITLQNGTQLVDPNQFLNGKIKKHWKDVLTQIFLATLLYFNILIAWTLNKKRRANQNKHNI